MKELNIHTGDRQPRRRGNTFRVLMKAAYWASFGKDVVIISHHRQWSTHLFEKMYEMLDVYLCGISKTKTGAGAPKIWMPNGCYIMFTEGKNEERLRGVGIDVEYIYDNDLY